MKFENIDISIVTFNSIKWIDGFFESLSKQSYPTNLLNIYIVDNCSEDQTVEGLQSIQKKYKVEFGKIEIARLPNRGYGTGHNFNINKATSKWILVTNIDVELEFDSLEIIISNAQNDQECVASWEFRQKPYEHPKDYNPFTLETEWSSHACILFRSTFLKSVGGYEEKIFMYGEDVELSFRLRSNGYMLRYCPKAVCWHYCYENIDKPKSLQLLGALKSNLFIRLRYGSLVNVIAWFPIFFGAVLVSKKYNLKLKELTTLLRDGIAESYYFKVQENLRSVKINFNRLDYTLKRDGYQYKYKCSNYLSPLVSIITRTHVGREELLKQAFQSVLNQTYVDIEWIVIEDGSKDSEDFMKEAAKLLKTRYISTEKLGRSVAGNIGLEASNGEFCMFLDDDDMLYPEHVEILVAELRNNLEIGAVYSTAYEVPSEILNLKPLQIKEAKKTVVYSQSFNRELLYTSNYLSIQSVLFRKNLYDLFGGFNTKLEYLEDWNLWTKYALRCDFKFIDKTTSMYRIPLKITERISRQKKIDAYLSIFCELQNQMIKEFNPEFLIESQKTIIIKLKTLSKVLLKKMRNLRVLYPTYYMIRIKWAKYRK